MWIVRLAMRNLARNRRRTLLSIIAVVVGVAALIIGKGFVSGLTENMVRAQIDSISGHVVARPADYPAQGMLHPVDALISVDDALTAWLDEHSDAWTARVLFAPTAIHRMDALRVRAIGYDPASDEAALPRPQWKVEGSIPGEGEQGVALSRGVSRLLELSVGDTITLRARTTQGAINALALPVSAIYSSGNPYLDRLTILVPRLSTDALLMSEGKASHLVMRERWRAESTAATLASGLRAQLGDGAEVATWVEETTDIQHIQRLRQRGLDILVFVLMAMSAAGIANTVLMSAFERIREVGTLRAMGMTEADVRRMFLVEGGVVGLVGGFLGMVIGGLIVVWFYEHGIDLSEPLENVASGNVPLGAMLYPAIDPFWWLIAPWFATLVATGASVYPAHMASRMSPAEAVRG